MPPFKAPCKYCIDTPEVYMEKGPDNHWIVTNLDGSKHYHKKSEIPQQQQQQEAVTFKNNEELAKYTYSARQEALAERDKQIQESFERKMTQGDKQIAAMQDQTQAIKDLASILHQFLPYFRPKAQT